MVHPVHHVRCAVHHGSHHCTPCARVTQVESVVVPDYAYLQMPLRAASDAPVAPTVLADVPSRTFTATAPFLVEDVPTDPQVLHAPHAGIWMHVHMCIRLTRACVWRAQVLTAGQAAKGVQFFFRAQLGYIELTARVSTRTHWLMAC